MAGLERNAQEVISIIIALYLDNFRSFHDIYSFSLTDRVWKRFTKKVVGEWKEELEFRDANVSSTS